MENYKKIKSDVTAIINNVDPWGLIEAGAPEDEYNGMVDQTISSYLNEKLSKENLEKIWGAPELKQNAIDELLEKVNKYFSENSEA